MRFQQEAQSSSLSACRDSERMWERCNCSIEELRATNSDSDSEWLGGMDSALAWRDRDCWFSEWREEEEQEIKSNEEADVKEWARERACLSSLEWEAVDCPLGDVRPTRMKSRARDELSSVSNCSAPAISEEWERMDASRQPWRSVARRNRPRPPGSAVSMPGSPSDSYAATAVSGQLGSTPPPAPSRSPPAPLATSSVWVSASAHSPTAASSASPSASSSPAVTHWWAAFEGGRLHPTAAASRSLASFAGRVCSERSSWW